MVASGVLGFCFLFAVCLTMIFQLYGVMDHYINKMSLWFLQLPGFKKIVLLTNWVLCFDWKLIQS